MAEFVYTPFTFDLFLHSGSKFEMTEVHEKDQVTLNNTTANLPPGGQPSIIKKIPSSLMLSQNLPNKMVMQLNIKEELKLAILLGLLSHKFVIIY